MLKFPQHLSITYIYVYKRYWFWKWSKITSKMIDTYFDEQLIYSISTSTSREIFSRENREGEVKRKKNVFANVIPSSLKDPPARKPIKTRLNTRIHEQ